MLRFLVLSSSIIVYTDCTGLNSKCDHDCDLLQQPELASKVEFDGWDKVELKLDIAC